MAVRIRLKRAGSRHRPFYKIIVVDSRSPRDGAAIESLGYYDPLKKPEELSIDEERYNHWVSVGASASEPVETLVARMKRRAAGLAVPEPEPVVEEKPAAEAAPEAEAAAEPEADKAGSGESEAAPAGDEAQPEGESDKK